MVLIIGAEEGTNDTGEYGEVQQFPYSSFMNQHWRQVGETRMAMLQGKSVGGQPTWNDLLYSHRMTYAPANVGGARANRSVRKLFAWHPELNTVISKSAESRSGYGNIQPLTDISGAIANASASAAQLAVGFSGTTAGQIVFDANLDRGVAALMCPMGIGSAGAITVVPYLALKYTDANNMVRVYRQSGTNIRVERVVAGVVTIELDITVNNDVGQKFRQTNVTVLGMHILSNNTTCRVFSQGTKIAEFELSAEAQALAGDQVAWGIPAATNWVMHTGLEVYAL